VCVCVLVWEGVELVARVCVCARVCVVSERVRCKCEEAQEPHKHLAQRRERPVEDTETSQWRTVCTSLGAREESGRRGRDGERLDLGDICGAGPGGPEL
jgi:hypothetical protein